MLDPTVDLLADLARIRPGPGVRGGTGRGALPLSQRGIRVHGIELSPAMAAELRQSTVGRDLSVTMGDFATTNMGQTFSLVYLLRNTITNLTTQPEQVDAFLNAAARTVERLARGAVHERQSSAHLGVDQDRVANPALWPGTRTTALPWWVLFARRDRHDASRGLTICLCNK